MGGKSFKWQGFPHACGDGPAGTKSVSARNLFSPRVWGWSEGRVGDQGGEHVFPTRVGMVRGPCVRPARCLTFSPRVWGWSGRRARPTLRLAVFPTRVGMVRMFSGRDSQRGIAATKQ